MDSEFNLEDNLSTSANKRQLQFLQKVVTNKNVLRSHFFLLGVKEPSMHVNIIYLHLSCSNNNKKVFVKLTINSIGLINTKSHVP